MKITVNKNYTTLEQATKVKEDIKNKWDSREQEFIFDHGWKFDSNEKLVLTKRQFDDYQYSGRSIRNENVKTLMIPSVHGCCLIFEGLHFKIEG